MKRIIVVGGGAAGLMAAISAAEHGGRVTVLEKMPSVGRKILITGKGRCNITNICDVETFINNIPGNGQFLYSALHAFSNIDMIKFLNKWGLETKVERGGRVFPVSDQARDVVQTFLKALNALKVEIITGQRIRKVVSYNGVVVSVITDQEADYPADAVIMATGGASYPGTGSSGDGYSIARALGHTIVPLNPSLVPLEVDETWVVQSLQGLSLRNVSAAVVVEGHKVAEEFGEMLFTHYGLSGPIILSLSRIVSEMLNKKKNVLIEINLKPALSSDILDKRIQRDFNKFSRKQIKNALNELLPATMVNVILDLAFIDQEKFVHQITKSERLRLLQQIQKFTFTIAATRSIAEAIVTAGGIHVREIQAKTMESKIIKNLFFAGEIIDIDGYTGGFNLQAAFSTGFVAGRSAADIHRHQPTKSGCLTGELH